MIEDGLPLRRYIDAPDEHRATRFRRGVEYSIAPGRGVFILTTSPPHSRARRTLESPMNPKPKTPRYRCAAGAKSHRSRPLAARRVPWASSPWRRSPSPRMDPAPSDEDTRTALSRTGSTTRKLISKEKSTSGPKSRQLLEEPHRRSFGAPDRVASRSGSAEARSQTSKRPTQRASTELLTPRAS